MRRNSIKSKYATSKKKKKVKMWVISQNQHHIHEAQNKSFIFNKQKYNWFNTICFKNHHTFRHCECSHYTFCVTLCSIQTIKHHCSHTHSTRVSVVTRLQDEWSWVSNLRRSKVVVVVVVVVVNLLLLQTSLRQKQQDHDTV